MKKKVILVQPHLGKYDMFIRDLPLSLLYAGSLVDRSKYELKLFDQRVEPDFEEKLILFSFAKKVFELFYRIQI